MIISAFFSVDILQGVCMVQDFFSGNPKPEWLPEPTQPNHDIKLLEDFFYTDPARRVWRDP